MNRLEELLCKTFDKKYGIFTGNGTTAMYLSFLALNMQDKKVIFPAITCTNPVNSAIYAGYQVDFCDVSLSDYTMDVQCLKKMLATEEYGIVVPTHIYGHRFADEIYDLCRVHNVLVMEDAAQTTSLGDAALSIMSFGHTKICETEHGGGIVFTNDLSLAQEIKTRKNVLNKDMYNFKERFDQYRQAYYQIAKSNEDITTKNRQLKQLQLNSKDTFIYDLEDNDQIADKLRDMKKICSARIDKRKRYEELLDKRLLVLPKTSVDTETLWRFTFLYKGNRDYLLDNARKRKLDISSWYPSLSQIYQNKELPNASLIESQVVNLWLDESHSITQIEQEISILNEIMREDFYGSK